MRVIVAGSRNIQDKKTIFEWLQRYSQDNKVTVVISGTARGVDLIGEEWAAEQKIPVIRCQADWRQYGRAAGPIRNEKMGDLADAAIVFWDGQSKGSKHMIDYMEKINKPVTVVMLDDDSATGPQRRSDSEEEA